MIDKTSSRNDEEWGKYRGFRHSLHWHVKMLNKYSAFAYVTWRHHFSPTLRANHVSLHVSPQREQTLSYFICYTYVCIYVYYIYIYTSSAVHGDNDRGNETGIILSINPVRERTENRKIDRHAYSRVSPCRNSLLERSVFHFAVILRRTQPTRNYQIRPLTVCYR